jgi:hypothetical protein
MPDKSYELHGVRVLECSAEGKRLRTGRDAVDLMSAMSEHEAALVVIPVERLDPDFFRLSTRIAGEIIQEFVDYRLRLAILGDISQHLAERKSLRDFVYEANRCNHFCFVASLEELDKRLERAEPRKA